MEEINKLIEKYEQRKTSAQNLMELEESKEEEIFGVSSNTWKIAVKSRILEIEEILEDLKELKNENTKS